jgi:hypothetical protein
MSEQGNRKKGHTVSAKLVFSGIIVVLIAALILGASSIINKGPITPLLGIVNLGGSTTTILPNGSPIVIQATCTVASNAYTCQNPNFNYTTGIYTVAISQKSGYNWTFVSVDFVPSTAVYSHGVPELSWFASKNTVNVTGGLPSNTVKYVNLPIFSGPVTMGANITGSIWAKYQMQVGGETLYANISTAYVAVKRGS